MERKMQVLATFIIAILLVVGLYIFSDWFSRVTGYFTGEDEKTKTLVCLQRSGAEFYGAEYCADCERQVALFGPSFSRVTYVDCGNEKENCPNLQSIPAWYINKTIHYGYKNLTELKTLVGCA